MGLYQCYIHSTAAVAEKPYFLLFYFFFFFVWLKNLFISIIPCCACWVCVCVCALCVHVLDACSTDFSPDVLSYFWVGGWVGLLFVVYIIGFVFLFRAVCLNHSGRVIRPGSTTTTDRGENQPNNNPKKKTGGDFVSFVRVSARK
jgi:hypothetical protein